MKNHFIAAVVLAVFPAFAFAESCETTIDSNDQMQFSKKEIVVPGSCKEFKVTLKHTGKFKKDIMGHNWVLSATADKGEVLKSGEKAGLPAGYKPTGPKVLAATELIGGGETTSVSFKTSVLKKGGDYTFVCTYPAHSGMMVGKLVFK